MTEHIDADHLKQIAWRAEAGITPSAPATLRLVGTIQQQDTEIEALKQEIVIANNVTEQQAIPLREARKLVDDVALDDKRLLEGLLYWLSN